MRVDNVKVYDLEESLIASGYAMIEEYDPEVVQAQVDGLKYMEGLDESLSDLQPFRRGVRLGNTPMGSGHGSFLKGIVVNLDLTLTNKAWIEFQRYHFADIITGMSTMHRIARFDLDKSFNEFVSPQIIAELQKIQQIYQENPTKENYLKLLYSTPSGLELTNRITTNYLQLRTMYYQRRNHRLPEWREFCQWMEENLPYFKELCLGKEQNHE